MSPRNGVFTKWALTLLGAGILSFGAWGGKTLISQGNRVTSLEATYGVVRDQLNRIEGKLDRLTERK